MLFSKLDLPAMEDKKVKIILLFLNIAVCSVVYAFSEVREFKYDLTDGKCINASGKEGKNVISKADFLSSKNAECGVPSFFVSREDVLQVYPNGNGILDEVNFKGADLSNMSFSGGPFCGINFTNTDIRGTDLKNTAGVYWCINGLIDKYSSFDLGNPDPQVVWGCKLIDSSHLKCVN
jgi:uncharacterized protein YjbI with pentapeptide repeats